MKQTLWHLHNIIMCACSHAATHKCVGDSGVFNGRPGTPSDVQELFWNRVHG